MQKANLILRPIQICLFIVCCYTTTFGQANKQSKIDLQKAKVIIDSLDKQYAKNFFNGDSVALAAMYTKDASFGSLKGHDILLALGSWIQNSIKDDTRNLIFTTTSLTIDSEFIVELGTYEVKDSSGKSKEKGKYLVVWKQEDGNWKLYKDIEL